MSDFTQNMFEAVESLVSRQIDSTPIDLTVTAEIALVRNVEVGEYKVTYKGDTFSAYSLDPMTVYKKGEEVYVLVPKGDFSSKKVILGKAAYNDTVSYADRQAMSNQWKTRGPNWLSNQWYWRDKEGKYRTDNDTRKAGIIATTPGEENLIAGAAGQPPSWREYIFYRDADVNPDAEEPTLTPARKNKITYPTVANRPSLTSLQKVDKEFQVYANAFEHVMISAKFETNFSMVHYSGEYGILVECWTDNPKYGKENYPDEPARIITTLRFSFNDFNGAPYQFNQASPQRAVFPVPKGVLKGLVRVSLFQDNGWNTDIVPVYIKEPTPEVSFDPGKGAKPVRDRNNIWATDIDIRWCEGINLEDSLFWLKIDAPRGTSLYNASGTIPANPSIPLEARLFYGSEEVTAPETCKFIWFRQKYSATMDKVDKDNDKDEYGRTWWDYGGNGWAPIDKIMLPGTDPGDGKPWSEFFGENANGINQYSYKDPEWHQTLNVGINVVPWQWRYKVVCVYNPSATNIEEKLERPGKEVILFETELVTNESSIHDFELPLPMVSNDLLMTYLRTRNNNLPWTEGVAADPQNPDNPDPARDWWCRWWMETPSGLYEPVPHTGDPRFQKGKMSINDYLHYDAITFKAQVFGKKNPAGATQEAKIADAAQVWPWPAGPDQTKEQNEYELANIEVTLLKSDELTLLVDWDGITNHSYNADGSILLQSSVGSEFFLRAILHWNDSSIMDYAIEWIAPDGITPLRHHSTYPGGNAVGSGFSMEDSMMYDMWVGADNIVRYKVNQKYDINKKKNTFTLRVSLIDGRVFEYHKEITFVKAGENGTQGSEWEARIWPTNESAVPPSGDMPGFESWTEEIRKYPRPLVVKGKFDGTSPAYTRNDNYKLFLRPFIYKNGKRIEELADADNYTYKVYWDSRYPNVKNPALSARYAARKGSFFEFVSTGSPINNPEGFSFGDTNPLNTPNLQAVTRHSDVSGGTVRTYGALEVRWRNQARVNGQTIKDLKYDFVIKAQVDIFQQDKLVATVFSYWPIDVVFTEDMNLTPALFDPNKINTNWPQFVLYNPTGYGPEVNQEHLRFYYGDKAWRQYDPLPFTATPINQTSIIQEVKRESNYVPKSWRLYPRPYYFFEECANGAISTNFTFDPDFVPPKDNPDAPPVARDNPDTGFTTPNPDMVSWIKCTYVRPIVYMLNAFGNTDINGWDGKSIDINDERGTIFAPTIGAGWKDPFTNKFSGVIMGIDSSQSKQIYQNIFGGFSQDDINKNPYMTGLFGYQNGVSSFGIMENGTAYFGRADRGGRIIIDGFNAQIYGGLKGDMTGGRDMDMSNRMRLSFIDFEGVAYDAGIGDTDEGRNSLETDGIKINTGSYNVERFFNLFATKNSTIQAQNAGFGSGRGAGTPAIEIGSYEQYIKLNPSVNKGNDLIRSISPAESKTQFDRIMDLEIPGYRKFLVTYDGTLYAMNAFIKGNIVGSNIIGSQFFNHDGSFGVDETGNLWAGSGYHDFEEYFVSNFGRWSSIRPEALDRAGVSDILLSSNDLWTNVKPNPIAAGVYNQVEAPFFVANDGRVFCQEIHISGSSSINIGGFHVVGNKWGGGESGDVFSFGTMYLIGPSNDSTVVEAWGNFYLRGKLTNLGSVFLGSAFEKNTSGTYAATSFNSPISITPTPGTQGSLISTPKLPVKIGVWPLYFHILDGALSSYNVNRAWVTLSTATSTGGQGNSAYMPGFSLRANTQFISGTDSLATNVTWRVDQLGQWTDAMIFTNREWTSYPQDTTPFSFGTHGLLYQGWWKETGPSGTIWSFAIKNVSAPAPSMVIQTLSDMRLSAGLIKVSRGTPVRPPSRVNQLILEAWEGNANSRSGIISVGAGVETDGSEGNRITLAAGTISLTGRQPGSNSTDSSNIQAFLYINGINSEGEIKDELGKPFDRKPKLDRGKIWMKGVGIALDGAQQLGAGTAGTGTTSYVGSVRINRSPDGSGGDWGSPTGGTTPVDSRGTVLLMAHDTINIRGSSSQTTQLWVNNIPAEKQFGIYARFA